MKHTNNSIRAEQIAFAWTKGLSNRVHNILIYGPFMSKAQIKKELGNGSWQSYQESQLKKYRNFGWKAWVELCIWCGLKKPNNRHSSLPKYAFQIKAICTHNGGKQFEANQDIEVSHRNFQRTWMLAMNRFTGKLPPNAKPMSICITLIKK